MSVPSSPNASATGAPPPANHIAIAPGSTAKLRSPITVAVLSIVTLGVYVLFWWYFINREMADYGRAVLESLLTPEIRQGVAAWLARLDELQPMVEPWLSHQTRDAYWQQGSVCETYEAIEAAVFAVGG